jgi:hypothetical protein
MLHTERDILEAMYDGPIPADARAHMPSDPISLYGWQSERRNCQIAAEQDLREAYKAIRAAKRAKATGWTSQKRSQLNAFADYRRLYHLLRNRVAECDRHIAALEASSSRLAAE